MKLNKLLATLFLFAPLVTFPWGNTGHRVVGQIAERHVKPTTLKKIKTLMGDESLAHAATWPDEIRSDDSRPDQHILPNWHFIEIPDGRTYDNAQKKPFGDAIFALQKMIGTLKNRKSGQEEKKVALRWVVHLVGDTHQPLHVGNGLDRGANLCVVDLGSHKTNLHSIIDDWVIDQTKLSFTELASFVDTTDPKILAQDRKGQLLDWVAESQKMRDVFYRDLAGAPKGARPYCQKEDAKGPPDVQMDLRSDAAKYKYMFEVRQFIEQRLRQAGIRLAKILDENL